MGGKGKPQQTSQTSPKFDGDCRNCGKYGHMAKDCWAKKADPKGGKKGGKGGGKKGAKGGKVGKNANSLDEPEAEASAWDMGSLDQADSTAGPEPACMSPLEARPAPDDWLRLNLDSGCALTTFPRTYSDHAVPQSILSCKGAGGAAGLFFPIFLGAASSCCNDDFFRPRWLR